MAKSVYKECFHHTLKVVEALVVHSIGLDWMNGMLTLITNILVHWKVVKDGVDEQGAQALPEEKCPIGDLYAHIIEYHSQTVRIFITIICQA